MLEQSDWSRCLALFTSHSDIVGSEEGEREKKGGRERKERGGRGRVEERERKEG